MKQTTSELQALLKLAGMFSEQKESTDFPFEEGDKVFIRTVTHFMVGKVKSSTDKYVCLEKASWVADSKRWFDCLSKGFDSQAEIEPEPNDVWIAQGAIVDMREWSHELPTKQQ